MGNSESAYDGAAPSEDRLAESDTLGYRVLGVQPNSPASSAGLVSFFDFLVGCEGRMLLNNGGDDSEDEENEGDNAEEEEDLGDVDFVQVLKDSVGKELELLVYNIKSQRTRLVYMTPQRDWGGKGLIGVTIRLDDYGGADERLIRVLSVQPNSPAEIAGLNPLTDYLLGTSTISFATDAILATVLHQFQDRPIEFYVYNTESDKVRIITLLPTYSWGGGDGGGGGGLLGAEVGTGYLHRIPHECRDTDGTSVEVKVVRAVTPKDYLLAAEKAAAAAALAAANGVGVAEVGIVNADGSGEEGTVQQQLVDLTADDDDDDDDYHHVQRQQQQPLPPPPVAVATGAEGVPPPAAATAAAPYSDPTGTQVAAAAAHLPPGEGTSSTSGLSGSVQSAPGASGQETSQQTAALPTTEGGDGGGEAMAASTGGNVVEETSAEGANTAARRQEGGQSDAEHREEAVSGDSGAAAAQPPSGPEAREEHHENPVVYSPEQTNRKSSASAAASFFSLPSLPNPFRSSGTYTPPRQEGEEVEVAE